MCRITFGLVRESELRDEGMHLDVRSERSRGRYIVGMVSGAGTARGKGCGGGGGGASAE